SRCSRKALMSPARRKVSALSRERAAMTARRGGVTLIGWAPGVAGFEKKERRTKSGWRPRRPSASSAGAGQQTDLGAGVETLGVAGVGRDSAVALGGDPA